MNRDRTLHRVARLRFWAFGLLALLLVPLGGSAIAAPGDSEQLQTVKVAILPLEPVGQVLYAKHRGFFRKQGLDVGSRFLRIRLRRPLPSSRATSSSRRSTSPGSHS